MYETLDVSYKEQQHYVHVLLSYKDSSLYIGYATNLKQRLISHASGKVISTKNHMPDKLFHYEYYINCNEATSREEYLKSEYGREQLKQI